ARTGRSRPDCRRGGASVAHAGRAIAADAPLRRPTVANGSGEPAVGDHSRPTRRGDPQLPAVRAPAGSDDVGTRGPAAGAARPAADGIVAFVSHLTRNARRG